MSNVLAATSAVLLALAPAAVSARSPSGSGNLGGGVHFGGGGHIGGARVGGGVHISRGSMNRTPAVNSRSLRMNQSVARAHDRSNRGPRYTNDRSRHHGHHHRHGHGIFIAGVPYLYDDYYSDYGGGCGWLYRQAVRTGSPYWWRRYEDCID